MHSMQERVTVRVYLEINVMIPFSATHLMISQAFPRRSVSMQSAARPRFPEVDGHGRNGRHPARFSCVRSKYNTEGRGSVGWRITNIAAGNATVSGFDAYSGNVVRARGAAVREGLRMRDQSRRQG
jgi:hypothetical protein